MMPILQPPSKTESDLRPRASSRGDDAGAVRADEDRARSIRSIAFTRTMSCTGMPSVIAQITSTPASAASRIASAANGGGTKIIVASAPVRSTASRPCRRSGARGRPGSALARRDAAHHLGAVVEAALGVEGPGRTGDALAENFRVSVDENGHSPGRIADSRRSSEPNVRDSGSTETGRPRQGGLDEASPGSDGTTAPLESGNVLLRRNRRLHSEAHRHDLCRRGRRHRSGGRGRRSHQAGSQADPRPPGDGAPRGLRRDVPARLQREPLQAELQGPGPRRLHRRRRHQGHARDRDGPARHHRHRLRRDERQRPHRPRVPSRSSSSTIWDSRRSTRRTPRTSSRASPEAARSPAAP